MRIHTVVSGETLRGIAERYGTNTRELVRLNEIENQDVLVPGVHLLIPDRNSYLAQAYTIKSGDTLPKIARRLGVPQSELESWTGSIESKGAKLIAGQRLYVPRRVKPKKTIEVNGYLLPAGTESDRSIVQDVGDALTYLSIFSYQARADGSLEPQKDEVALQAMRLAKVKPLMTVTNFDGNNFNTELAHTVMSNTSIRRKLMGHIVSTAKSKGFGGVNVDFEHMRPSDRPLYNQFIKELAADVHRQGMSISIAMGPKTADMPMASWMGAFDYKTLGAEVDFLMLMTYEWGWVGGPPMTRFGLQVNNRFRMSG
jgi:spore germination protein